MGIHFSRPCPSWKHELSCILIVWTRTPIFSNAGSQSNGKKEAVTAVVVHAAKGVGCLVWDI